MALNRRRVRARPREVLLVGRFVVGVAGREHHAFYAKLHHLVEKVPDALRIGAVKERRVGGDPETALHRFSDAFHCEFKAAFPCRLRNRGGLSRQIQMHRKGQVLTGFEEVQLLFEKERVGAEINVLFARDQAFDDFVDFRVHQRFATGIRNHRRAALLVSLEALFRCHVHFENMRGVLDFATTGTGQIATEQRFQHEHQRIPPAPGSTLPEHIAHDRPHLWRWAHPL